jgi:copper chaperone CopZ
MTTAKFNIDGMHCGHCAALVKNSLSIVDGVSTSDVQVGTATVQYDDSRTNVYEISKAITRFGYKIKE